MPSWTPEPIWRGEDCYIIGGGPSLESFDFDLLKDRHTIGCNSAHLLGPDVVDVLFFGDIQFFKAHKDELEKFEGLIVTCHPLLKNGVPSWLNHIPRIPRGLSHEAVGWNTNTGAAAINLAFLLGAKRVFLLGFDMASKEGKHNWHDKNHKVPKDSVYDKFMDNFRWLIRDWKRWFSDREIINVTDDSRLTCFPVVSIREHFAGVGGKL